MYSGPVKGLTRTKASITGQYVSGKKKIPVPKHRRQPGEEWLTIRGAREHNLQNIDVSIPLGCFVSVTGVSGSGKSSLVRDILLPSLMQKIYKSKDAPGKHKTIEGIGLLDKVIDMDQSPIGRTPRSNPATYTGVFDHIRKLFAKTQEAKVRGYLPGRFSFNVAGGRCEACAGDGTIKIEMHFLPDVYVPCEVCKGARYNRDTLDITFKGKNIAEVLDMPCSEAVEFFANQPAISRHMQTLVDVGLGYVRLGQPAPTLSGGEAQRVKLSSELAKRSTGHTIYLLDEPTTGSALRGRPPAADRAVEVGRPGQHRPRHRAQPRRDQECRLADRPRTRGWLRRRHGRRRGHARARRHDRGELDRQLPRPCPQRLTPVHPRPPAVASKSMVARPPTGSIPESPGSYQFKDAQGRVIYVGKASSLRQRLSNYFQDPRNMHPRTAQMVATAETVEWIEVRNEVEALMLEYTLIKQHRPRFNVRLRDDKSYPFLAVTVDEQWPRALVMRGHKRKGVRYFGPYAHAYAIRDTLDLLLRTFPIRTCSPGKFNQHQKLGRPCLLFHIEKCSGPCVGEIEEMPYRQLVRDLCDFLDGDTDEIVKRLTSDMRAAASELEFERAARLRDRLTAVQRAIEKQQMVGDRNEDIDVIGTRRRRPRSGRAGVLRPQGPGRRAQGVHPRQGRGPVARAARSTASSRSCTATSRRSACRSRCWCRSPRPTCATYEEWLTPHPWLEGADPRAAAGRQARSARDGQPQREGGVRPPPAAPRERPQQP